MKGVSTPQHVNRHARLNIPIESLPFYPSLKFASENTGIDMYDILVYNSGFRAQPAECICGHEWNAYDLIIESVNRSRHDWNFFRGL